MFPGCAHSDEDHSVLVCITKFIWDNKKFIGYGIFDDDYQVKQNGPCYR